MFGMRRTRARRAPVATTHHTTVHTTRRPSKTSMIMNRLRPRRNTAPAHGSYGAPVVTTTHAPRARRTGFGRKRHVHSTAPHHHHQHHHHTTTTAAPRRKTSIGDKVSGAMLKLRGSMSGRPGVKAAGTRRMHGTDGRGSVRRYY